MTASQVNQSSSFMTSSSGALCQARGGEKPALGATQMVVRDGDFTLLCEWARRGAIRASNPSDSNEAEIASPGNREGRVSRSARQLVLCTVVAAEQQAA